MDKQVELLLNKLSRAIEANDKEMLAEINEEVEKILLKLLPVVDEQP